MGGKMIDLLNHRNTETVEQALKDIYDKVYALDNKVTLQNSALMSLTEKVTLLEAVVQIQKMKLTGLGPSVKE